LAIEVHSEIPLGRGLGSSAAVAVAAAAAAGAAEPMAYGAAVDGHPENAAASTLGGLVAATTVDGRAVARRLPLDAALRFVVVVPDRELPTVSARAVLKPRVDLSDAAFNLGRMGVLIAGLADHHQLLAAAGEDRLHQDARSALFPEAPKLLAGLLAAGALMACWSGAGSSLLGVCTEAALGKVEAAATLLLRDAGLPGQVWSLAADLEGVTVLAAPDH
jgi:homoserine kinase